MISKATFWCPLLFLYGFTVSNFDKNLPILKRLFRFEYKIHFEVARLHAQCCQLASLSCHWYQKKRDELSCSCCSKGGWVMWFNVPKIYTHGFIKFSHGTYGLFNWLSLGTMDAYPEKSGLCSILMRPTSAVIHFSRASKNYVWIRKGRSKYEHAS